MEDIQDRRIGKGVQRGQSFEIEINGQRVLAYEGETIAAVLMAVGKHIFRRTRIDDHPRGLFCGIGLCHECLVVIDGQPNVQACQTLAFPGCKVQTQIGWGNLEVES
ncbi:MAG: (2Fe-2S)-binding protein [Spirochaetales bacterium]|nr:(2Fe-2S)-binding protein [Spirochaetales bacterium]